MVTRIMAINQIDLTNRDNRSATDSDKKKSQNKATFKEVFAKELSTTAKRLLPRI